MPAHSTFSPEQKQAAVTEICDRIAKGASAKRACQVKDGLPSWSTFYRWTVSDPDVNRQYEEAFKLKCMMWSEQLVEMADGNHHKDEKTRFQSGVVHRDRLSVDTRKYVIGKWLNRYAEKFTAEVTNDTTIRVILEDGPAIDREKLVAGLNADN